MYDQDANQVVRRHLRHAWPEPEQDWVEYDPAKILHDAESLIAATLADAQLSAGDLAAVGIANQRETTIVWNRRTGMPYYPAISAFDRRTTGIAESLLENHADLVKKKTGLAPDALFSACKLQWILDNVDDVRADALRGDAAFGTLDSWLIWNLTGGPDGGQHVTDVTNASRTMLMNLETEDWDDELLSIFRVPRPMLPVIGSSSDPSIFGKTSRSGSMAAEVPIAGVLAEHQAALVGQQGLNENAARYCLEASGLLMVNTGTTRVESGPDTLTTVAYRFGNDRTRYVVEGFVPFTGATIQWLVDGLGIIRGVGEIEAMSRRADDPEGMYFVPAFGGLSIPRADTGARGVIVGLDSHHNQNHLARATLHALAYQAKDLLELIKRESGVKPRLLRVDGNGAWFDMCMQVHADILGIGLSRPANVTDPAALGASYAAGLAIGIWRDASEILTTRQESHRWSPQWTEEQRRDGHAGWIKAVQRAYGWQDGATARPGDRFASMAAAEWQADGSR